MKKEFEKIQSLNVSVIMRVSAHGGGLYLYIPKDIVEAYGILAGHKLEVKLLGHFRPKQIEGDEEITWTAPHVQSRQNAATGKMN